MKNPSRIICLFAFWLALSSGLTTAQQRPDQDATAQEKRKGLWHALDKKSGTTLFFLIYNGEQSRYYTSDWDRINASFDLSEEEMRFRIPVGTTGTEVTVRFEGDGLAGDYLKPHPQFPWKIEWQGRQINQDPDWQPWGFLKEAEGGVVNPLAKLIENGPYPDQAKLDRVWLEKIEAVYYPLLTHTVYFDPRNPPLESIRKNLLSKLFPILKDRWEELASFSQQFAKMTKKVAGDLKEIYPWLDTSGYLVPMVSADEFDYSFIALPSKANPKRFLFLGSDWMVEHLSGSQQRYFAAQGLLLLDHLTWQRPGLFLQTEFAQRGMASFLAARLGYSEDPKDFLFQDQGDDEKRKAAFMEFSQLLSKHFREKSYRMRKDFFLSQHRSSSYLFAYDFARVLSQRFEPRALLQTLRYDRLREEMIAYMRALKAVPYLTATPKEEKAEDTEGSASP